MKSAAFIRLIAKTTPISPEIEDIHNAMIDYELLLSQYNDAPLNYAEMVIRLTRTDVYFKIKRKYPAYVVGDLPPDKLEENKNNGKKLQPQGIP